MTLCKQCTNYVQRLKPGSSLAKFAPEKSKRPMRLKKERYVQQFHRTALCAKNLFNNYIT